LLLRSTEVVVVPPLQVQTVLHTGPAGYLPTHSKAIMYQESSCEFPKVSAVVSSKPVSASESLAMLIEFLTAEQHKLESSNHWEDIFLVSETLAHTDKEREKLRDLRGIATQNSIEEVAAADDFKQADRVVKREPSSPLDENQLLEKEEIKTLEKAERKAAKAAEKDEKKKRKEAKKERKEAKKQKR
jgi:hypothetical protein